MPKLLHISLKAWAKAALFLVITLFVGCHADPESEPTPLDATGISNKGSSHANAALHNKALADVRSATARYHRIEEAIADGYVPSSPCVSVPGLGGMGYHYVKPDYRNGEFFIDGNLDYRHPEALLYEPQKNGRMMLVGVEFIINAEEWHQNQGPTKTPEFGGHPFDVYINHPNNPLPFDNYQLHVWVWKHNPAGMHTPFNPTVSCEFAEDAEVH